MTLFEQERKAIREKIWSLMDVHKGDSVLDIGVGRQAHSLVKLRELGVAVTSIDLDLGALRKHKTTGARFVQCNAAFLPFKNSLFALAIANFTFHEIDPSLHQKVFSELCRVAQRVMVVEPAHGRDPVYRSYQKIWTDAMHSIDQLEDYATIERWSQLMRNCGSSITVSRSFGSSERLIGQEAREYMTSVLDDMQEEGVSPEYIEEMRKLKAEV
jgi:ubiquinone/menaquinone biosynthesis C-methylase UbiE